MSSNVFSAMASTKCRGNGTNIIKITANEKAKDKKVPFILGLRSTTSQTFSKREIRLCVYSILDNITQC